jgi:hypothetical protein
MAKIFIFGFIAVAIFACAPANDQPVDITSSDRVCVDSHFGQYCKDLQGKFLTGVELASGQSEP